MKFDKEMAIKHKFWLVLGGFLVLWLVGIVVLGVSASEPIKKHKEEYKSAKTSIEGALQKYPKNKSFETPWNEHGKLFRDHKDVIWAQAWEIQKDMYTWPSSREAPFQEKMKDPSVELSLEERQAYKDVLYWTQFDKLEKEVPLAPIELRGGLKEIMAPVPWGDKAPTREEIWLAQEDFWVKRDLLDIIRNVQTTLAQLAPVSAKDDEKGLPGALAHYRFVNDTWQLDIYIEQGPEKRDKLISAKSTIKNVHTGKRKLPLSTPLSPDGIVFRLTQGANPPIKIKITGEPLAWGKTAEFRKAFQFLPFDYNEPFAVEQTFDWYSSPIKRLDALVLPFQSARTVSAPLKPNPRLPIDAQAAGAAPPAGPEGAMAGNPGGGMAGGMGGGQPKPGPGPGGPGGPKGPGGGNAPPAAGDTPTTPVYGLNRLRYLQATPQCRHLPLAMLLVMDQRSVPDLMAAVANSPLRIQVTQVQITHARNVPAPASPSDPSKKDGSKPGGTPASGPPPAGSPPTSTPPGGGGRPGIGRGGEGMGGEEGPVRPGPGPGPTPPGPGTGPGGPKQVAPAEADPNLVEVAVYGIAALYERFDPSAVGTPTKTPAGPGGKQPDKPGPGPGPGAKGNPPGKG